MTRFESAESASFSTRLRLRNGDTDQFRHVNNAAIATCFEEARMAIFQQADLAPCMAGKTVVVAHLAIDFLSEVFYPGEIEVRTTPVAARNTSFELMQGLYMGDTLCARAKAICVLMDAAQARPTPLPDAFRDRLTLRPCA
ncbi:acyl-CoA thioester hydrolase [Cupriavidus sp. OV038]|uniref:acyl-CoA thioesterase n=1 Tax=unclassified Cupriavidus TaxID=2640874 RepID=UPI0008E18ED5|nr:MULTISPECIES: thioesterase family protein [unclassified Cupriavidus]SFC43399.1 acyl-CoA thioester hydrolase [Cupriavidus sp. OV038]SFP32248.1 acyl-CoA thioester hydrolase [Cupriavidus sp. OV096]